MRKIVFFLFITLFSFGQEVFLWNIGDPDIYLHYIDEKWCDSTDSTSTVADYMTQWIYNGNIDDCLQPSEGFIEAWWTEGEDVPLVLHDSYDCCCKDASTPGHASVGYTGFGGSACEDYLISINWNPFSEMLSKSKEQEQIGELYIDTFGRQHIVPPKGLSIKDGQKYFRL
tara:strand:+ start:377 stop:889 length:513 start_codon:yes stop_codon:yes gene_type:complete